MQAIVFVMAKTAEIKADIVTYPVSENQGHKHVTTTSSAHGVWEGGQRVFSGDCAGYQRESFPSLDQGLTRQRGRSPATLRLA